MIVASAFLAFKTSHVQIPAMNDSKQIGLAIYTSGWAWLAERTGTRLLTVAALG